MNKIRTAIAFYVFIIGICASSAFGQQIECSSKADRVKGVTNPNGHVITTTRRPEPNLPGTRSAVRRPPVATL